MGPTIDGIFGAEFWMGAFFSKNTPKLPFLAWVVQMKKEEVFLALSTIGSCPRLLGEHVQKVL
jgi:hypothetical protein